MYPLRTARCLHVIQSTMALFEPIRIIQQTGIPKTIIVAIVCAYVVHGTIEWLMPLFVLENREAMPNVSSHGTLINLNFLTMSGYSLLK